MESITTGEKAAPNVNNEENERTGSPKIKSNPRGRKRKRESSNSGSENDEILPDNALQVEKTVHISAVKNNLDDNSVRKLLKKVVTNEHVLALVKLKEEEEYSQTCNEVNISPKLTRAKVKELMRVSPRSATTNLVNIELTPIKHIPVKTRPEVTALIAQELPDDEDDEEYEPTQEEVQSDDDQTMESCSDLDSLPHTPATPHNHADSPKVVTDGPFKVPQEIKTPVRRKLELEEEATIALRTRSKLSLSETPIEHIESSFVPPDELPMPDVDDLWSGFLQECLNPASMSKNEDDDEADPEYNVAADPDAHEEDEEALENSIIKISKKELNDLVTELFSVLPDESVDTAFSENLNSIAIHSANISNLNQNWDGKQEPISDEDTHAATAPCDRRHSTTIVSVGKTEPDFDENEQINNTSQNNNDTNNQNFDPNNQNHDPNIQQISSNGESSRNVIERNINKIDGTPSRLVNYVKILPKTDKKFVRRVNKVEISVREEEASVAPAPQGVAPPAALRRLHTHSSVHATTITVDPKLELLPEQKLILEQQLRQHIQLAASNFLQLYVHPVHWALGPTYKEYLDSLNKIGVDNPDSIVNVCNLKPAWDLVNTWELTMSENTPENIKMVEFIQGQVERNRRRAAQNVLYVGEFHSNMKEVVSNSCVFLYPRLLPPAPYRADPLRRYSYLRSEDELIALTLDQFWQYIEDNPALFPPSRAPRWALTAAARLVCKLVLPWVPLKGLLAHISKIRRSTDKENPIYKFIHHREITPVKHKLLPFKPNGTLYELPEHEMPRIWVRHLAKTSYRFKQYLYRRVITSEPVAGKTIDISDKIETPQKPPLPSDFHATIPCSRSNLLPKCEPKPLPEVTVATNVYSVVQTSTGAFLVPLVLQTNTTSTNQGPITTAKENSTIINNNFPENSKVLLQENTHSKDIASENVKNKESKETVITIDQGKITTEVRKIETVKGNIKGKDRVIEKHCICCVLLRKICKLRQTSIKEYLHVKSEAKCPCSEISYSKITNKLKLLVNFHKTQSNCALSELNQKLKMLQNGIEENKSSENILYGTDELAFVTNFQMRLSIRTGVARNNYIKKKIHSLLSNFVPGSHDPLKLAADLYEAFEVELYDMYQEFISFLTPDQADKIDRFKDYFVPNCLNKLVKKIEEQVKPTKTKESILYQLYNSLDNNSLSSCQICTNVLGAMTSYPELAKYVFSLFPHIAHKRVVQHTESVKLDSCKEFDNDKHKGESKCVESLIVMDYEADHSSSGEEAGINSPRSVTADVEMLAEKDIKEEVSDLNEEYQTNETEDQECQINITVNQDFQRNELEVNELQTNETGSKESHTSETEIQQSRINETENQESQRNETENQESQTSATENQHSRTNEPENLESQKSEDENQQSRTNETETQESQSSDTENQESQTSETENHDSSSEKSMLIMSEDEIKTESIEWKREEDKLILEVIKQSLTPEATLLELIDDNKLVNRLCESLVDKSTRDINERIKYLIEMLVSSGS